MLVQAEPAFGKRFAADSFGATTQLLKLMARLAPHLRRTADREVSDGRGKGKGKGAGTVPNPAHRPANKGNGKGASKGGGKGSAQPSFAGLKIPDCFTAPNSINTPLTNACELRDGLLGVAQVDHAVARDLANTYLLTEPFSTPCAVLTSMQGSQELFEKRQDMVKRFGIQKITVPVLRGGAAGAKTVEALLFQLGPHNCPVQFNDPTVTHVLGDLDAGTTRGTAYIYKNMVPPNSFEELAKECHDYVVTALGAANLDTSFKIRPQMVTEVEV